MATHSTSVPPPVMLFAQHAINHDPSPTPAEAFPPQLSEDDLRAVFHDFDDPSVYENTVQKAFAASAMNFVIEFGADKAQIACDLSENQVAKLLDTRQHADMPVRWINIWNPNSQRGVVEAIGRRYHFSKRLTRSIWAWDESKERRAREKQTAQASADRTQKKDGWSTRFPHVVHRQKTSPGAPGGDYGAVEGDGASVSFARASGLEDGAGSAPSSSMPDTSPERPASDHGNAAKATLLRGDLAVFEMMQGILNYTTIDQEEPFVCIGANWLHKLPGKKGTRSTSLVPPKHWSWFALCEKNTVISFHEAAHYRKAPESEDRGIWEQEELKSMRSNTFKVFCQLSKCGSRKEFYAFTQLASVRRFGRRRSRVAADLDAEGVDGSSNLFYYLFEDYTAAIDILKGSKLVLDEIRTQILGTAEWNNLQDTTNVIRRLYELNKELRQLHHLFANYKILISQLLDSDSYEVYRDYEDESEDVQNGRHNDDNISSSNNNNSSSSSNTNVNNEMNNNMDSSEKSSGSRRHRLLSVKAANRFRRLQAQLQTLMLDAIQDCLDEKTSLQNTYFNLITQKDSQSTERLTRSATLLAKLSVFFLPISFMTSYFSIQIPGLIDGYTTKTYWAAFGVIAGVSFLSLFFFSKVLMFLSERLDHWTDGAARWTSEKMSLGRRNVRQGDDGED